LKRRDVLCIINPSATGSGDSGNDGDSGNARQELDICESPVSGVYVKGLTETPCPNIQDVSTLVDHALKKQVVISGRRDTRWNGKIRLFSSIQGFLKKDIICM
jgi:hypothetical protein